MVNGGVFLQYGGFYGGNIGNFLSNLEQLGFFDYVLPFLVIFAIIFGILARVKIFEDNKAVNGIIAVSVSLMALQFGLVSNFFAELFPRFGIGLSIILVILVLVGLFMDPNEKWISYTMLGIGAIIVVAILIQSAGGLGFGSYWWYNNWPELIAYAVVIGLLIAVFASGGKGSSRSGPGDSPLERALRGN